jgi:hypothetical protein
MAISGHFKMFDRAYIAHSPPALWRRRQNFSGERLDVVRSLYLNSAGGCARNNKVRPIDRNNSKKYSRRSPEDHGAATRGSSWLVRLAPRPAEVRAILLEGASR